MPTNEFLPFGIGGGAAVETQVNYQAASWRINGFPSGLLGKTQLNKALRQATTITSAFADVVTVLGGLDMLDDGNMANIRQAMYQALSARIPFNPATTYPEESVGAALKAALGYGAPAGILAFDLARETGAELVGFKRTVIGAVARQLASVLDDRASIKDMPGVVGDGVHDDTIGIMMAEATGRSFWWPDGTYLVTDTLVFNTQQRWYGRNATIKMSHTSGYCKPLMWLKPGAGGSIFSGIRFDHNGAGVTQATLGNQLAFAFLSAVVCSADEVLFDTCRFINGWDNGLAVGYFTITGNGSSGSPYSAAQTVQSPARVRAVHCASFNNGCGVHNAFGEQGKKGAGFNNLTGICTTFDTCISISDYNAFTNDFGGGGQLAMPNCIAYNTKRDSAFPSNGSGIPFWIGDGPNVMTGVRAYFPEGEALFVDASCQGLDGDLLVAAGQREAAVIKSGKVRLKLTAHSCCLAAANTYDPLVFDSSYSAWVGAFVELRVYGTNHRYGFSCTGGNSLQASVVAVGPIAGATGAYLANPGSSHYVAVQSNALNRWGFGCADPLFEVEVSGKTTSYLADVVGDFTGNGTFVISDVDNRNNRLAMGYDSANNAGVIQAVTTGFGKRPLLLNPSGGEVIVGVGTWQEPVRIGSGDYVWIEPTSPRKLRIKSGAPTAANDGTVIVSF